MVSLKANVLFVPTCDQHRQHDVDVPIRTDKRLRIGVCELLARSYGARMFRLALEYHAPVSYPCASIELPLRYPCATLELPLSYP